MAGKSPYVRVTGLDELVAKFRYLGETEALERISYRATFGASKELRAAAIQRAEATTAQHTGALLRGFAMKRIRDGTKRGYTVGVRHGRRSIKRKGEGRDDPWYWWMLEFGTRFIAPHSFIRAPFAELQTRSVSEIIAAGRKAVLDSGNRALARFGSGKR